MFDSEEVQIPHQDNAWFVSPLDMRAFPDYRSVCPRPMVMRSIALETEIKAHLTLTLLKDLGTLRDRIASGKYRASEFEADVRLTFENAIAYNKNVKVWMAFTLKRVFLRSCAS